MSVWTNLPIATLTLQQEWIPEMPCSIPENLCSICSCHLLKWPNSTFLICCPLPSDCFQQPTITRHFQLQLLLHLSTFYYSLILLKFCLIWLNYLKKYIQWTKIRMFSIYPPWLKINIFSFFILAKKGVQIFWLIFISDYYRWFWMYFPYISC